MSSSNQEQPALKILFATSECAPLVKTGGLGDVSAALPAALRAAGLDVRVLLPGYRAVLADYPGAAELGRMVALGQPVRLLEAQLPGGVPLIILDCPRLFDRGAGPYQADDGEDWEDNAMRFGVLSNVAAVLATSTSPLDWRPDVLHCNDWPAALAPAYLAFEPGPKAATLVTIHNLAFQGNFDAEDMHAIELPAPALGMDGVEFFGRYSFLKGGLVYGDAINTVSPTYAREIQGSELGFGMEGVLRMRADRLFGVLNGIDTAVWDPRSDLHIPSRYGADSLDKKIANKAALRERFKLGGRGELPLLGMVTRLTHQKGVDLVIAAAQELIEMPAQIVIVGTGDHGLVDSLYAMHSAHPRDFGVVIGFDEPLAHMVEAGADVFLMPSRFEPCGMNQMYSQRYGTPPIVNATGGLVDTVEDGKTGFMMQQATSEELVAACRRALACWKDRQRWHAVQAAGMAKDFGWGPAAREYAEIYRSLVATAKA